MLLLPLLNTNLFLFYILGKYPSSPHKYSPPQKFTDCVRKEIVV